MRFWKFEEMKAVFRNNEVEPEWMPYCMMVLTNLVSRSKTVVEKIRNSVRGCFLLKRFGDVYFATVDVFFLGIELFI